TLRRWCACAGPACARSTSTLPCATSRPTKEACRTSNTCAITCCCRGCTCACSAASCCACPCCCGAASAAAESARGPPASSGLAQAQPHHGGDHDQPSQHLDQRDRLTQEH